MSLFATVKVAVDALEPGELAAGFRPEYLTGIQVGSQFYYGQAVMSGWLESSGGDIPVSARDPRAVRPPKANDVLSKFRGFLVLRHDLSTGDDRGGIPNFLDDQGLIPFDYLIAGMIRVTAQTALVRGAPIGIRLTPPASDDWWNVGQIVALPATPDPVNVLDIAGAGWTYAGADVDAGALITIARKLQGS